MTAVYSFASPSRKIGFIAVDDLDSSTGAKAEKIVLCSRRFAIAGTGKAVPVRALQSIAGCEEYDNIESPKSLNDILDQAWDLTKLLCECYYVREQARKNRDEVSEIDWALFIASSAKLVILDCETYAIHEVEQQLFPPERINPLATVQHKKPDTLHLAELASFVVRRNGEAADFDNAEQILSFLAKRISEDHAAEPKIGGLGSIVIVHRGQISNYSAFKGPRDYIENLLKGCGLRTANEDP